jgi:hypothetical protein
MDCWKLLAAIQNFTNFSKKVSNVVVTLSPLDGLLEVVGGHPELDEGTLAFPLHKLHEVEQGRVVEQNVRYKNLKGRDQ